MKKLTKSLIIIAAVILLIIACAVCYLLGLRQGLRAGHLTAELAEFTLMHQHIDDQMANANCPALKETLNEYLALLEKYKDFEHGLILSRTAYYGDKILTHARLARIERKLGNEREAENHMKLAVEACKDHGWRDCSEDKIVSFTRKIEEENPIGCLSNSK